MTLGSTPMNWFWMSEYSDYNPEAVLCLGFGVLGLFLGAGIGIGLHEWVKCRRLNQWLKEQDAEDDGS